MGAPVSSTEPGEQPTAESLLTSFKTIEAAERRKHASVLNYWLSIRGDKDLPPLHDFDPLEISDAAPHSLLVELIGGGEDAEIRHLGEQLKTLGEVERIIDAPRPSLLASIASKLSIVAISRNFLAFEDEFPSGEGTMRCWVTLLPLSAAGAWVDYVYGYASFTAVADESEEAPEAEPADEPAEPAAAEVAPEEPAAADSETVADEPVAVESQAAEEPAPKGSSAAPADKRPGFSKLFDAIVGAGGYYGSTVKFEPTGPAVLSIEEPAAANEAEENAAEAAPAAQVEESRAEPPADQAAEEPEAEVPAAEPICAQEGVLQTKLKEVRGKADEARLAKLKSNAALYDGLSAAYDFALDAEDSPEDYLKLVEAQGLKIQLRSPMTPVVRLAFNGMCDDGMIAQLEAVLAWALEQDLPRGSLAERIHEAGGIGPILNGQAKAA